MLVKGTAGLPAHISSILLIQLGDIGDVVLTTPTVRAIRESFPSSRLNVAVRGKAKGILECCPAVDRVLYIEKSGNSVLESMQKNWGFFRRLREEPLDLCVELRTGTRGSIMALLSGAPVRIGRYSETDTFWRNRLFTHLVRPENEGLQYCAEHSLNILAPFGISTERRLPELDVPLATRHRATDLLSEAGLSPGRSFVAVQPFSLWRYKEWPQRRFAQLLTHLASDLGTAVVLVGGPDERARAGALAAESRGEVINLAGKTTLAELAGILVRAELMIGCDSAGIHIAAAVGTPTISIFGPSAPVSWAPRGVRHHVVNQPWECVPCRRKGCQDSELSRCLETLPVSAVLDKVISTLGNPVTRDRALYAER